MATPLSTSIELRHLRYFVAAAEHGSFRKAGAALADLFHMYDQRCSGVHIDFVEAPAESHAAAIRRFDLDAAFILGRQGWADWDAVPLWTEPSFFALPRLHRLAQRAALFWHDLVDETFLVRTQGSGNEVRNFLERKFRELDISPRISTQQLARYSLLGLVATGRGIVPVLQSETVISLPEVMYRPLAGEEVPFSVIYSPKNDNPAVRTLLSLTRTMARERVAPR